jgi:hypothetical protein
MNFTKIIVLFLLIISIFSIHACADDVIDNGDFFYNYSGWDFYCGLPPASYTYDWFETNASTHDGYIRFITNHGAGTYGHIYLNLSQDVDFTNANTLYMKAKTPDAGSYVRYASPEYLKMSAGSIISNTFSHTNSWDIMSFDVSSISGVHTLTIEFYSKYAGAIPYGHQTVFEVDYIRSDGYSPPEEPTSINFYPDVDDSTESYQHFDYHINTSNQNFTDYFVTSTYAPESYNIVTYQNNISGSYGESNVSLNYYLPTGFSNYTLQMYGTNESLYNINTASLIAESDILYLSAPMNLEFIMYDKAEYTEYDTARIYYNISSFVDLYPTDSFKYYMKMFQVQAVI